MICSSLTWQGEKVPAAGGGAVSRILEHAQASKDVGAVEFRATVPEDETFTTRLRGAPWFALDS